MSKVRQQSYLPNMFYFVKKSLIDKYSKLKHPGYIDNASKFRFDFVVIFFHAARVNNLLLIIKSLVAV